MTQMLAKAVEKISKLPARKQNEIARRLLDEEDDLLWDTKFEKTAKKLDQFASTLRNEIKAGKVRKGGFGSA